MSPGRRLPGRSIRPPGHALLARGPRHLLSPEERRALRGQRVLITGAAGWLGTALARRIADARPAHLTLFDLSDSRLVRLELALLQRQPDLPVSAVLGDATRLSDVREVIRSTRPDVVFHLAAASEVSTAERAVCATVRTNVFGTLHVAREASLAGARLVLVSNRQAADAASVLGATRRLAELVSLCPAHAGFRPVIVRVDDLVDGPAGAVGQMIERLEERQPLLVANAGVALPLMTTAEAVALALKADLVGLAGETYRAETGDPVRLVDVARRLLAWAEGAGLATVPVRIASAARAGGPAIPGDADGFEPSRDPMLLVRRDAVPDTVAMSRILRALRHDLRRRDALAVLASLRAAIPRYQPSRTARELAAETTLHASWPALSRAAVPLSA